MGKIILQSVQERRNLRDILNGKYRPEFKQGYGAFDEECSRNYKYMLDMLASKTGDRYIFGKDTCMWAWYKNPYYRNHVNYKTVGTDMVLITFEIDEDLVLFSDFDRWCERLHEGNDLEVLVDKNKVDEDDCIQAVCWMIPPEGVLKVEPFSLSLIEE